jgi:hypothetical protein
LPNRLASPTYTRIISVKLPTGVSLSTKASELLHIYKNHQPPGLPMANLSNSLIMMEIKGLVEQVGGTKYSRGPGLVTI